VGARRQPAALTAGLDALASELVPGEVRSARSRQTSTPVRTASGAASQLTTTPSCARPRARGARPAEIRSAELGQWDSDSSGLWRLKLERLRLGLLRSQSASHPSRRRDRPAPAPSDAAAGWRWDSVGRLVSSCTTEHGQPREVLSFEALGSTEVVASTERPSLETARERVEQVVHASTGVLEVRENPKICAERSRRAPVDT